MQGYVPLMTVATAAVIAVAAGQNATAASTPPSPAPTASATPLERVAAYVEPSVVYEEIDWSGTVYDTYNKGFLNNGKPFTVSYQCTGFVVNPAGYIATAGHCVDYDKETAAALLKVGAKWALDNNYFVDKTLTVEDVLKLDQLQVRGPDTTGHATRDITTAWGASVSGIEAAKQKPARLLAFQHFEQGDAALLRVEARDLNAIQLATTTDVQVGQDIVAIGYPASVDEVTDPDLHPSFKAGQVSSVKTRGQGLLTVYELSAAVSGGMSGGPTVDMTGRVIGINSFSIVGEPQQFNFVNSADRIAELMSGAGVRNEPSPDSIKYRQGLDAFFANDKATAVAALGAVAKDQPANGLAATYLRKANALPDPVTPGRDATNTGPSAGFLAAGVSGGLLLLAGLVALLVWRLHARKPAAVGAAGTPAVPSTPHQHMAPTESASPQSVPSARTAPPTQPVPPTPTQPLASAHCTACGQPLTPEQRFCANCGRDVRSG